MEGDYYASYYSNFPADLLQWTCDPCTSSYSFNPEIYTIYSVDQAIFEFQCDCGGFVSSYNVCSMDNECKVEYYYAVYVSRDSTPVPGWTSHQPYVTIIRGMTPATPMAMLLYERPFPTRNTLTHIHLIPCIVAGV